jgi:hypothetical protein
MDYVKMTQLEDVIENFRPQMLLFSSELGILKDTIEKSIKANIFTEYSSLQKKVNKLLNKITDSKVFYEYSKDKTMRPLSGASYSFDVENSQKSEKFFKALGSASDAIKERYEKEMKLFETKCKEKLKRKYENLLEQMAQKIADTEEFKKQVEDQLESITAERNHLKTELETIKNLYDEENKTKILNERKDINQQPVQDAYYSETSEYEVFDENFCLRLDLLKRPHSDSYKKMKNFVNKVRFSKAILPDIKRINIENSDNDDSDLKEFLSTCFPHHLELFYFKSQGNIDFYIEAFQQSLPNVT